LPQPWLAANDRRVLSGSGDGAALPPAGAVDVNWLESINHDTYRQTSSSKIYVDAVVNVTGNVPECRTCARQLMTHRAMY